MTRLTESQIRTIARIARDELGSAATLEQLREVVQLAVDKLERQGPVGYKSLPEGRILVICISTDGLLNSRVLSESTRESGCKVAERFERKMSGFHVLLAVIDPTICSEDFDTIRAKFAEMGNAAGVRIILQPEDSFVRNASNE
jgi:hypothetical protein